MFSTTELNSASQLFDNLKKNNPSEIVYSKYFPSQLFNIWFRSLNVDDLNLIYKWVNLPYAKKFWQMDGSREQLQQAFEQVLYSNSEHSFIGVLNSEEVCQVDIYYAPKNEVANFYKAGDNDIGMHLLMTPEVNQGIRYLSLNVMHTMLEYLFSYSFIENIITEPDSNNIKACNLLVRCGFSHVGNFQMSSKLAAVFTINKAQFQQHFKL